MGKFSGQTFAKKIPQNFHNNIIVRIPPGTAIVAVNRNFSLVVGFPASFNYESESRKWPHKKKIERVGQCIIRPVKGENGKKCSISVPEQSGQVLIDIALA